jgi:hypothetical protein
MTEDVHLRLAGVTRLHLAQSRGPHDVFVFDPHRLALPCWALALEERGATAPALLVTFDRHFDLVAPRPPFPTRASGVRAIDEHARWNLDVRNYDHVLAAMEAGIVGDAIVIARGRPRGALEVPSYRDAKGDLHRIMSAPRLDMLLEDARGERTVSASVAELIASASPVLLDFDLDCFTTQSDADPTAIIPWTRGLIREHLLPLGAAAFWDPVLSKAICVTLAREPHHCGGLLASGELFADAAQVLFPEVLGSELP